MRDTNHGSDIAKIMRLMDDAINDGEHRLRQRRGEIVRRCAANMSREYEMALSLSLKLSLTVRQCQTFDDKSHQVESIRVRLERLSDECARREAVLRAFQRRQESSAFRATVQFLDHCLQFAETAVAMRRMNADIMRRTLHR